MADYGNGSPLPNPDAVAASHGKGERTPSASQHLHRRNQRHRKNQSQSVSAVDGTVSDSVTNPVASARSKKGPKQKQQSVTVGAPPSQNGNAGGTNGQKQRPVSFGGNMLPATPLKEQAYAAPTFQASPAPSSLPVPKFFSKSVPNVAMQQSMEARMAGEKTPEKEESSPEPDVVSPEPPSRAAQQSPLDMFFKADKEEKERGGSGGMLSPGVTERRVPATEPKNPFQQSGRTIFLGGLDRDEGDVPSPKTVPNNKRPQLAQRASSSPSAGAPESDAECQREAYTRSLKDLLFSNVSAAPLQSSTPPQTQGRPRSNPRTSNDNLQTPSPLHRPVSGPSSPAPSTEQQNHYSLHYGNRNLSPLFKAARNETPSRPSGLRKQELLASDGASGAASSKGIPVQPRQPPQIDPDSFSRSFIDQHAQPSRSGSGPVPQQSLTDGARHSSSWASASGSGPLYPSQHGVRAPQPSGHGSGATPRTGSTSGAGSRDISSMEDDLRRMLKLNVLSN